DTRNIGKVRVHPEDPDTAYVAALGHAHGPNTERGVFRTRDGGKTWKKVLYRSETAGAVDISLDPNNPRIIYASFWEAIRRPWELVSGGPGSGIFRSNDGGDTWTEISRSKGLPKGLLGKIGISASAAKSGRVYAIVEAEDGGSNRSRTAITTTSGSTRGIRIGSSTATTAARSSPKTAARAGRLSTTSRRPSSIT